MGVECNWTYDLNDNLKSTEILTIRCPFSVYPLGTKRLKVAPSKFLKPLLPLFLELFLYFGLIPAMLIGPT